MKLLMISGDRSILAGKKGAFWYTLEQFAKEWDRIDVICPRAIKEEAPRVQFGNVYFHPCPHGLVRQAGWIVRVGKALIAEHHHDVMTVHEYPPFYNGIGARSLTAATGVSHVLEIHHIVGYPVPASFSEWIGYWMSRAYLPWAARGAARIRTVSKSVAQALRRFYVPASKIVVVPSFYLDHALFASSGDVPAAQYDLVFCARLVPNKGLRSVLDALVLLPQATLLVIGDGPQRAAMERYAGTLGIAHRVEFRGWVSESRDVLRAIRSARIFVMASSSEGGPRIVLEAMAAGMPVIATKVGVVPEVIHDRENGLYTSGTPEDLAEKARMLLSDESLRRSMGEQARRVLEQFERGTLVRRYAALLQEVAASHVPHS